MSFEKLIKGGKVAVLYSPGYGAGWSTWASLATQEQRERLLMDKELVMAVLNQDMDLTAEIAEKIDPEMYLGGMEKLDVKWIEQGDRFEVDEYDGNESVRVLGPDDGYVA